MNNQLITGGEFLVQLSCGLQQIIFTNETVLSLNEKEYFSDFSFLFAKAFIQKWLNRSSTQNTN